MYLDEEREIETPRLGAVTLVQITFIINIL